MYVLRGNDWRTFERKHEGARFHVDAADNDAFRTQDPTENTGDRFAAYSPLICREAS